MNERPDTDMPSAKISLLDKIIMTGIGTVFVAASLMKDSKSSWTGRLTDEAAKTIEKDLTR